MIAVGEEPALLVQAPTTSDGIWDAAQDSRNFQVWASAMKDGYYQLAWALNERRGHHWPSAHRCRRENPLCARPVSLTGLHGLGDVVQMMRFVPRLRQEGCLLRCYVRSELLPLLPHFAGMNDVEVVDLKSGVSSDEQDRVELMELPHLLRVTPHSLPSGFYLHMPDGLVHLVSTRMRAGQKRRVGLVWTGSSVDPDRWINVHMLHRALNIASVELWNLQGGSAQKEGRLPGVQQSAEALPSTSLDSYCALIANLDLVITTDTLAAHLAGALGIPVWILLKHDADWRWMRERSDSPWYASARLFRQHKRGEWKSVLDAVRSQLTK